LYNWAHWLKRGIEVELHSLSTAEIVRLCAQGGDVEAWEEFVHRFQPLIASTVIRVARRYGTPTPALTDDLIQETYLRICRNNCKTLRDFEAKHEDAIFGLLKVIAASVALDYFRSRMTQKRKLEMPDDGVERDSSVSSSQAEHTLLREIERCVDRIVENQRDRAIFRFYYRQGYSARDIAALPGMGLSAKGVESCLYRVTEALRRELTQSALKEKLFPKGNSPQSTLGVIK
jgi:RNA polymerase sigma-70 factor (ECF subfamily)